MRKPLYCVAVLLAVALPASAVEWTPVFNASLAGGQYFFQKQRGNLGGNATMTAATVAKFNERSVFSNADYFTFNFSANCISGFHLRPRVFS